MLTILLYCYTGTTITNNLGELADITYVSKWYKYDVKMQKWLVIIIANSQQALIFDGFKITKLSLTTFAKVKTQK